MINFRQLRASVRLCVLAAGLLCAVDRANGDGELFQLTTIGTLPVPTMMHGSVYADSRLYILGGNTLGQGWTNRVWSANVTGAGRLEEWRSEASLPALRAYISNSVTVVDGHIYVFGGSIYPSRQSGDEAGRPATDYLVAKIGKNGVLQPWHKNPGHAPLAVSCTVACSTGTRVFVIGGTTGNGYSDAVEVGETDAPGSPVRWRTGARLPVALWFHAAGIVGNHLYAWGGLPSGNNTQVNSKCWRAELAPDGSIGEWQEQLTHTAPTYSGACVALHDCLISAGGRLSGGLPTNRLDYVRVPVDGMADWKIQPTSMEARLFSSAAAAVERGCFYISGGLNRRVAGLVPGAEYPSVDEVIMCRPEK